MHLRAGHMIPLQDSWALNSNTTADLQKEPVDFHIHPDCTTDTCTAAYTYLNDDGETLATDDSRNIYGLVFSYAKATKTSLTLTVT